VEDGEHGNEKEVGHEKEERGRRSYSYGHAKVRTNLGRSTCSQCMYPHSDLRYSSRTPPPITKAQPDAPKRFTVPVLTDCVATSVIIVNTISL
jgi:hypothetical protein